MTIIEAPSILLPLLIELLRPFIELPAWTFLVALTEMLLAIRLVVEGCTLAPPLKRLVSVIDLAMPNMLALIFVLAPLSMLTSLMHSQLFGLFDDGWADRTVSLSRVVNMLTAPPSQENTEGRQKEAQPGGSELLFYWSTFVIRLCFGSFIVAILVGAFNKVVVNEQERALDRQRDASLPPGYEPPPDLSSSRSTCARLTAFANYFFTARLYGSTGPRLTRSIEAQIALTELADPTGATTEEQIMLSEEELTEVVGGGPARQLLLRYGARQLSDEEALGA